MSESDAVVMGIDGDFAWVEVQRASACGRCENNGSCATGLLGVQVRPARYRVRNRIGAREGDRVVLSVAEGIVFKVAMLVYFLPLAVALLGAAFGSAWGDLETSLGMLLGLAVGFLGVRGLQAHMGWGREPAAAIRLKSQVVQLHR